LFGHEGDDVSGVVVQSGPVGDLGNAGVARGARGLLSDVGIVSLIGQSTVGDDVFVGQPGKSTSASSIAQLGLGLQASVRAINDPLLRERGQSVSSQEPLSLNVFSGGEGPARTAALLVLHGGDGSLGSPIERGWDLEASVNLGNSVVWPDASVVDLEGLHQHGLLEFLVAHVREFVQAKGGLWVILVQLLVSLEVSSEVAQALLVFSLSGVLFSVVLHPLLEHLLLLLSGIGGSVEICDCAGDGQEGQNEDSDIHVGNRFKCAKKT